MPLVCYSEADGIINTIENGEFPPWVTLAPESKRPKFRREHLKTVQKYNIRKIDEKSTVFQRTGGVNKRVLLKEDLNKIIDERHKDGDKHLPCDETVEKIRLDYTCWNLPKWVKERLGDCGGCKPIDNDAAMDVDAVAPVEARTASMRITRSQVQQTVETVTEVVNGSNDQKKIKKTRTETTTTTRFHQQGGSSSVDQEGMNKIEDDWPTPLSSVAIPTRHRPCYHHFNEHLEHAGVLERFWAGAQRIPVPSPDGHHYMIGMHDQNTRVVCSISCKDDGVEAYAKLIAENVFGYQTGNREVMVPYHFSLGMVREVIELARMQYVVGVFPTIRRAPHGHPEAIINERYLGSVVRAFVDDSDEDIVQGVPPHWPALMPAINRVINLDEDSRKDPFSFSKRYHVNRFEREEIEEVANREEREKRAKRVGEY